MKKIFTQTRLNVVLKIKSLAFILICLANSASAFVTTICDNNGTAQHPVWICMTLQNVPCSQVSYIAGMTCSEQYFAVPPKIIVLADGHVFINDRGVLSTFAPDKINTFLQETVATLPVKERKVQLSALLKNGDNKVSQARIMALSKELNAEVVYSKETLASYRSAGSPDKAATGPVLSLGAGIMNPVHSLKQDANISNGYSIGANLYLPLFSGANTNFGLNVGGEYFAGNKDYDTNDFKGYNISGQTGEPVISAKGSGSPKQAGFKTEGGIQANFVFGQVTVSPILNAAYFSFNQKGFAVKQNSSVNGQRRDFDLYRQAESKTSGLAIVPKMQLKYKFGRDSRFSIYTEGNYTFGPKVSNETSSFKPNGMADPKTGAYNVDQMLSGTNTTVVKSNSFRSFAVNVGISFNFPGVNPMAGENARAHKKAARQAKRAVKKAN